MTSFDPTNRPKVPAKLVLEQEEVAALLVVSALALSAVECPRNADGNCPSCNAFLKFFWNLSNELDRPYRLAYQKHCADRGIPLPPAPWEDGDGVGEPIHDA